MNQEKLFFKVKEMNVDNQVLAQVSPDFISLYGYIPFYVTETEVYLLHYDQTRILDYAPYRFIFRKKEKVFLGSLEEYDNLLRIIKNEFNSSLFNDTFENLSIPVLKEESEFYNPEIKSALIVRTLDGVMEQAIIKHASDIHFEPQDKKVLVRYRIDGELNVVNELNFQVYEQIVSRIKVLGNLDITKHFLPQDGKLTYDFSNENYDIRISILPTSYGERVSLRILDNHTREFNLDDLYLDQQAKDELNKLVNIPNGIILVTGPTGSGKTTTLYSLLKKRINEKVNIISVEDPVEYSIPGICQVSIDEEVGLTFAETLRSVLRQDPDILMIGEIRDEETAQIAIRSAITGHLVFSTLHTNDSIGAIIRLLDMKIPPYLVASAVKGVISQRLVKKLCDNCKEEVIAKKNKQKKIAYQAVGCSKCNYTKEAGRMAVGEVLIIDEKIAESISLGTYKETINEYYEKNKTKKLLKVAKEAVKEGLISENELQKINNGN